MLTLEREIISCLSTLEWKINKIRSSFSPLDPDLSKSSFCKTTPLQLLLLQSTPSYQVSIQFSFCNLHREQIRIVRFNSSASSLFPLFHSFFFCFPSFRSICAGSCQFSEQFEHLCQYQFTRVKAMIEEWKLWAAAAAEPLKMLFGWGTLLRRREEGVNWGQRQNFMTFFYSSQGNARLFA